MLTTEFLAALDELEPTEQKGLLQWGLRALSPWGSLSSTFSSTLESKAKHTTDRQMGTQLPVEDVSAHILLCRFLSSTHQPAHLLKPGLSTQTLLSASKERTSHQKQDQRLSPLLYCSSQMSGSIISIFPGHQPCSQSVPSPPCPPSLVLTRTLKQGAGTRGTTVPRVPHQPHGRRSQADARGPARRSAFPSDFISLFFSIKFLHNFTI